MAVHSGIIFRKEPTTISNTEMGFLCILYERSRFQLLETGALFVVLKNTNQFGWDIFVFLAEKQLCAQKTLASVVALL